MITRGNCWLMVGVLFLFIVGSVALGAAALSPVGVGQVHLDDAFWSPKREVWRKVTINDCFDKFEKDGALTNFDKIRDGQGGEHGGPPWYDGLIYETITGSADFLGETPDAQLEARIDGYIDRIAAAADKDPDGYINTYTQMKEPTHRWGVNGGNDRWQHDLYNAGCLAEAGVHYYRATGKPKLLQVAARMANLMCDVMGPAPRKNIIPGHAVGELALTEMYQLFQAEPELKKRMPFAVDEGRYLKLAEFWIDARGHHDGRQSYGAYDQDDQPVARQPAIEGHAVRATLMATGLTALASITDRPEYRATARRLWTNMVERRMYVTGGVGAIAGDEKFGDDYVLPSNGYLETCAAVGAGFFHQRMNLDTGEARDADELERVLYNGALCGVSLSGNRYFYENPLEAGKNRLRWMWNSCPCCPPMFLKMMGAMPGYIYATGTDRLCVNLYVGSTVKTQVAGQPVVLKQTTRYPWAGSVSLELQNEKPVDFEMDLRVPRWCQEAEGEPELYTPIGRPKAEGFTLAVNGKPVKTEISKGYAMVRRTWSRGDTVDLTMKMEPRRLMPDAKIKATTGQVALSLGPVVYCLESADNDGHVRNLSLPDDATLQAEIRPDLLGGVTVIRAHALASIAGQEKPRPVELTAIPYYANANRGPVSMQVWIPRLPGGALPAKELGNDK